MNQNQKLKLELDLNLQDIKILIVNKTDLLIKNIDSLNKKEIINHLNCLKDLIDKY